MYKVIQMALRGIFWLVGKSGYIAVSPWDHPGFQAPKAYPQARKQPSRPTAELPYFLLKQKTKWESPWAVLSQKIKQPGLRTGATEEADDDICMVVLWCLICCWFF